MPKASKTSASETVEMEGYEGHLQNFEGGHTVAFEKYTADADLSEFFKGLPDDQCQAPHWGYVLAGKVTFKTPSGEETFETGDAYYVPRVTPRCSTPAPKSSSSARPSSSSRPSTWSRRTWKPPAESDTCCVGGQA
jgi:hypothetical protein